jgi:hypothetical protein
MILTSLSLFIYGLLKGVKDYEMKFNTDSWKNKYKQPFIDSTTTKNKWYNKYHQIFKLKYKEKWFTSATLTVFLTDKWHLADLFSLLVILFIAFVVVKFTLVNVIIMYICFRIGFFLTYELRQK